VGRKGNHDKGTCGHGVRPYEEFVSGRTGRVSSLQSFPSSFVTASVEYMVSSVVRPVGVYWYPRGIGRYYCTAHGEFVAEVVHLGTLSNLALLHPETSHSQALGTVADDDIAAAAAAAAVMVTGTGVAGFGRGVEGGCPAVVDHHCLSIQQPSASLATRSMQSLGEGKSAQRESERYEASRSPHQEEVPECPSSSSQVYVPVYSPIEYPVA